MCMEELLFERLYQIQTSRSLDNRTFAKLIGIPATTYQGLVERKSVPSGLILFKTLATFPEISAEWLLRGEGDMCKMGSGNSVNVSGHHNVAAGNNVIGSLPMNVQEDKIPLITPEVSKQPDLDIHEEYEANNLKLQKVPYVKQFGDYTASYVVQNNAMFPDYHAGDRIAIKRTGSKSVINGNVYVLDTMRGMCLRRVADDNHGHLICKALDNENYPDMIISKKEIFSVFVILGQLRLFC